MSFVVKTLTFKTIFLFAVLHGLSACSTTNISDLISSNESNVLEAGGSLYLRGSFNWWEAEEPYRFKKVSSSLYVVKAHLVADGQPYDFKIADKEWSIGMRCGYLNKETDEVLTIGSVSLANCDTPVDNFQFTPLTTGEYKFYLRLGKEDKTEIFISN